MPGNSVTRALVLTTVALAVEACAADQQVTPQYSNFAVFIQSPPHEPLFFWDRFDYSFENDVNDVFADSLQPLDVIKWNLSLPGKDFAENFRAHSAHAARGAFEKSMEYSLRDAAVETPAMHWLEDHDGWFADLLKDSVDNVGEETVAPLDVSYHVTEQSWWSAFLRNGGTHYGIRPLRSSPYAYISQSFSDGENTLFLANIRYYYDHFSEHRAELALSIPLRYGLMMDIGTDYGFGTHTEERCVVKLLKELKGGGIAHVGFEVKERPILIAGITFGW